MLIDERAYTLDVREIDHYLAGCRDRGLPIQRRHGGNLVAAFTTNTGVLNQLVQWWAWQDPAERDERRRARDADPEWQAYLADNRGRVLRQESRLMVPADFSRLKDKVPPLEGRALVYEERSFTLFPGQLAAFVALVRDRLLSLFERYGYELVGFYTLDTGTLNQVVFLQRWKSLDERAENAAAFLKDKEVQDYRLANTARIITQEARILVPTDFSPLN